MNGKSINVPYPGGLSTDWISSLLIRRVRSPLVMMGFGRLLKKKQKLFLRSAFNSSYQMQLNHLKKQRQRTTLVHMTT